MDRLRPIKGRDNTSMDHFGKSREKTFAPLDRILTNFNEKSFKMNFLWLVLLPPPRFDQFKYFELKQIELHDEARKKFSSYRKYQKNQIIFRNAGNKVDQSIARWCPEHNIWTTRISGIEGSDNSLHEVFAFVLKFWDFWDLLNEFFSIL